VIDEVGEGVDGNRERAGAYRHVRVGDADVVKQRRRLCCCRFFAPRFS
jgi:hypothetical protein